MATYYNETNQEGSRDLFYKRQFYSMALNKYRGTYANLVDFNFAEKQLYGRVDRRFVPRIFRNEGNVVLKQFRGGFVTTPTLQAANFVVDAFHALAQQFKKCAMVGKIDATDPYLSNLLVHKAYVAPLMLYQGRRGFRNNDIKNYFRVNKILFRNFDEFMVHLENYFNNTPMEVPYTLPGFIKSRFCPIAVSGLSIEIAALDPANDEEKINQFVNSKNWEFYVNACRSYGFMVDKNVPWRIVADIGSPEMMKFAAKYSVQTTDQLLLGSYTYAHNRDFNNFKFNLLRLYNMTKRKNFLERKLCGDGRLINKIITPTNYSVVDFERLYSDYYFIDKYFDIRFNEEESPFTLTQKNLLIDDAKELYEIVGLYGALNFLEIIINKPFDYRGSWTYIKEQVAAKQNDFSNTR